MRTCCPACKTCFILAPEDITAAGGKVRCGQCHTVFDTLSHLVGTPAEPATTVEPVIEPPPAAHSTERKRRAVVISRPPRREEPAAKVVDEAPIEQADQTANEEKELPWHLGEPPTRHALWPTVGWFLGSLLMLFLLAAQYIYIERYTYVTKPSLRPWLELACRYSGCELPPRRATGQILMLDNTIQSHPQLQDSLLITATLLNKAGFAQPYPVVELVMVDLDQKVIARRRFRPREYLVDGDPGEPFAEENEAHLQLEVVDPGRDAVGFEFNLL